MLRQMSLNGYKPVLQKEDYFDFYPPSDNPPYKRTPEEAWDRFWNMDIEMQAGYFQMKPLYCERVQTMYGDGLKLIRRNGTIPIAVILEIYIPEGFPELGDKPKPSIHLKLNKFAAKQGKSLKELCKKATFCDFKIGDSKKDEKWKMTIQIDDKALKINKQRIGDR